MQSYKDLEVYKLAHQSAIDIHKLSLGLPKLEMYEEGSQIRRSSKSISANIVEGFARKNYRQDYIRFLICAHASCDETKEHLDYLYETGSLKERKKYQDLKEQLTLLSKKLNKFIQVVRSHST